MKMKIEVMLAVAVSACGSFAMAHANASYPSEKLAAFVVEKLDVTSLPSVYRPKKENGKKTFSDYGYTSQKVDEKEALVQASSGARRLSIRILQDGTAGIYACVAAPGEGGGAPVAQSVILLKRKDSGELLKGRESVKEFASCPVVGGSDDVASAY
jgi:hypothetical protein